MRTRFQVIRRWAAYRLGLRNKKGLRNFYLSLRKDGATLWADNEHGIPTLLASTKETPGHWFGDVAAEFYEGDPRSAPYKDPEYEALMRRHIEVMGGSKQTCIIPKK